VAREHGCKAAFSPHFARQPPEASIDEHGQAGLARRVAVGGTRRNGSAARPGLDHRVNHVEPDEGLVAMTDEQGFALLRGAALGDGLDSGAERERELAQWIANRDRVAAVFDCEGPNGIVLGAVHDDDAGKKAGRSRAIQLEEDVPEELAVVPLGQELLATEAFASARGRNESEDSHGAVRLPNLRGGVKPRGPRAHSARFGRMDDGLASRRLFDIPEDVTYLNCAYMSPLLRSVREAGVQAVGRKSRPWEITPAGFFESMETPRGLFAALIGASPDTVALIPAASYGMAIAARNVPLAPGRRVLLLDEEFPSTTYAWLERARAAGAEAVLLPRPADDDWTRVVLEAIDDRTAVAALPHCHWTDGGLLDLARIRAALDAVGAALALDVTQSLGALPLDLASVDPDFMVAACYKWLLGPYSTGFLYVAPRWHGGTPLEWSWIAREGSEDFSKLVHYRDGFRPGARRFDVGEPSNFALMPMVSEAIRQIQRWTIPAIQQELRGYCADLVRAVAPMGFTSVSPERRAGHYLGLRHPRGIPAGLAGQLAESRIYVSVRGPSLRVTPHLYNNTADRDRLVKALEALAL